MGKIIIDEKELNELIDFVESKRFCVDFLGKSLFDNNDVDFVLTKLSIIKMCAEKTQ